MHDESPCSDMAEQYCLEEIEKWPSKGCTTQLAETMRVELKVACLPSRPVRRSFKCLKRVGGSWQTEVD